MKITENPYGPTKDFPGFYDEPVQFQLRCRAMFYEYVFLYYEQRVALANEDFVEHVRSFPDNKPQN